MKEAYSVDGPEGTHNLKSAHKIHDVYIEIISLELKALIYHNCLTDSSI
jgi:hypothetical protein